MVLLWKTYHSTNHEKWYYYGRLTRVLIMDEMTVIAHHVIKDTLGVSCRILYEQVPEQNLTVAHLLELCHEHESHCPDVIDFADIFFLNVDFSSFWFDDFNEAAMSFLGSVTTINFLVDFLCFSRHLVKKIHESSIWYYSILLGELEEFLDICLQCFDCEAANLYLSASVEQLTKLSLGQKTHAFSNGSIQIVIKESMTKEI